MVSAIASSVWVVEGKIDLPVYFNLPPHSRFDGFWVALGGEGLDGFVHLRPTDPLRVTSAVFWSPNEPVPYELRAAVRALNALAALLRGSELTEQLADRLTMITGYPVKVLSIGYTYNEDQLRECIAGNRSAYDATTGVEEIFKTNVPKNWQLPQLLSPPRSSLEALRWFRHAMTSQRRVDQFLAYYIALESIAPHIPGVIPRTRPRSICFWRKPGLETQVNAAIKYLITRYPTLPRKTKRVIAKIRARLVHGSSDSETLSLASANLPLVQRLAADGIALVYGVDPAALQFLSPRPIEAMAPMLVAPYSVESDPSARWGGLLSDFFAIHPNPRAKG